jgi:hypothetical protein
MITYREEKSTRSSPHYVVRHDVGVLPWHVCYKFQQWVSFLEKRTKINSRHLSLRETKGVEGGGGGRGGQILGGRLDTRQERHTATLLRYLFWANENGVTLVGCRSGCRSCASFS